MLANRLTRILLAGLALGMLTASAGPGLAAEQLVSGPAESRVASEAGAPVVTGLVPTLLPLVQGASGMVRVTINAAQGTETVIAIQSSDGTVAFVPATVTVPAGEIAALVPVAAGSPGAATLTASLNGTMAQTRVTVTTAPPALVSLLPPVLPLTEGSTGALTVTLNANQPAETVVLLTTSDPNVVGLPADRVIVPGGRTSVAVPVAGLSLGTATVTASLNGTTSTAAITVQPPPPTLTGLACPATLTDGATIYCTLMLNAAQSSDTLIALYTSDSDVVAVAATVTVPAHTRTASVAVTGTGRGVATVTAGPLHQTTQTATVQVLGPPPTVVSLVPSPASLGVGATATLTLMLNAAQLTETIVTLASTPAAIVHVPATVTVPAGSLTATFPLTALAAGQATVSAGPLHGSQAQTAVTVTPRPPTLTGLTPPALTLPQGSAEPLAVTIAPAQPAPTVVPLTSSDPGRVEVPPSVPVPAGETSVPFPVIGRAPGEATVTAGPLGGASRQATVTVRPPDLLILTLAPTSVLLTFGQAQQFTAAGTFTDGSTQDLTAVVSWASSSPAVAAISAAGVAMALSEGTATVTATHPTGRSASAVVAVSAAGVSPHSLTGSGLPGTPQVHTQQAQSPTVPGGGQTALTGRIVDTHRRPIPGVAVQMPVGSTTLEAVTDATGTFLLQGVPAGEQLVLVDGYPASHAQANYPTIPITVSIQPGVVNRMPFTPHLHAQKDRNFTPIHPTRETIVTDPELPGVALRIPAGAQIIGWDGQPNTKVSIRTVPIDRLPVAPVPPEVSARTVYMFYFGKRGGGTATQPIPFDAPNDLGLKPGEKADLWHFDESHLPGRGPNAWRKLGTGTVTPDGTLIRSDPGVGIPKFCCGAALYNPQRGGGQQPGRTVWRDAGADPVDLSTGIFMLTVTDLVLPGRIPVAVTRTYRSGDSVWGPFGLGTTLGYDDYLQHPGTDVFRYVYGANATTDFARQPDGSFINTAVPAFRGARLTENPDSTRTLRFKDGSALLFSGNGQQIRQRDPHGNEVVIEREWAGNTSALREPSGRALEFTWLGSDGQQILSVRDPLGRTLQYEYDGQRRLTAVTNPAGGVTRYTYDAQHRMTSITDRRGIVFLQNTYDVNSRVCQQQQADGGWFRMFYITADRATLPESEQLLNEAAAGGPITQAPCTGVASSAIVTATVLVDPRGKPTTYRFNGQGYLIQVTDALGQVTTYERQDGTNLLLSTTDPLIRVTRFQYDPNGNVTQITPPVTDPPTPPRTFTYDPTFNTVTSSTDPLGNLTTFEYDAQGNLTAITDPEQTLKPAPERLKTRMTYNPSGQVLTATDPLNQTTTFTYTSQGDLETITDPLGHTTQRTYDGVSRLSTQTDPLGRTTQFGYDPLNRLTTIVDPLKGQTTFTYDPNGNLLTVSDAWGNTTTHEYDSMDRLSRRIDPLGKAETFGYDGNGNLTTTIDRKNQPTTFTYDALNRRTRAEYADGSVATFTYDAGSRLTQANDTADPHRPIALTYDPLDRLLSETTTLGTVGYAYDAAGRRTSMTVGGQAPVTYTYDHNARLRTITQAPMTPVDIQYDAGGRRTVLTLPNGVSTEYQYDLASRLTALIYRNALGPLGDLQYSYDAVGNRTATGGSFARTLLPDGVATSTYDCGNRQLAFGPQTLTFDDNGNLLTQTDPSGTVTFTWDARNRMTAMVSPSVSASFAYDGFGRRAIKTASGQETSFQYDGLDAVKESNGGTDVAYLRTLSVDEVLARTDTVDTVHFVADALGSTVALADPTGSPTTTYTYEPYGRTEVAGTGINAFQYTGRENDGTGLYYYRARYYDPGRGRFVQEDPIGLGGGDLNVFAYAFNNPILFTDPTGQAILLPPSCSAPSLSGRKSSFLSDLLHDLKCNPRYWIIEPGILSVGGGQAISIGKNALAHVLERHGFGSAVGNASKFAQGVNIRSLIQAAEAVTPTPALYPNTLQRIVDAGHVIGIDRASAKLTQIYTVITDAVGNLITAFPGMP